MMTPVGAFLSGLSQNQKTRLVVSALSWILGINTKESTVTFNGVTNRGEKVVYRDLDLSVARRTAVALIIICSALSIASSTSLAGTVSVGSSSTSIAYAPSGSENNHLTVSRDAFAWQFEDFLGITAGAGCTQVSSTFVSCPSVSVTDLSIDTGEGTDSVSMGSAAMIPAYVMTTIRNVGNVLAGDGPVDIEVVDSANDVSGGAGYDTIAFYSDPADATISGGAKDDEIRIENSLPASIDEADPHAIGSTQSISGGDGNDLIDASNSGRNLYYINSAGTDVFIGGSGNDEIQFGEGSDLVFGGKGNDRFKPDGTPGAGDVEAWGGPGDDVFYDPTPSSSEPTHFEGGPGKDTVTWSTDSSGSQDVNVTMDDIADDGVVQFGGIPEGDHVHASVENVGGLPSGTFGHQLQGDDYIEASDRANTINTAGGSDVVKSFGGNDRVTVSDGNDTALGGYGNDELIDGTGNDTLNGEDGIDRLTYAGSAAVTVDLGLTTAQDTGGSGLDTILGIEHLTGTNAGDTLTGNDELNRIDGRGGNDQIHVVGGGLDTVICGTGNDTVYLDASFDVILDPDNCETVNEE